MANGNNQPAQSSKLLKINDGEGYTGDIVFANGSSTLYQNVTIEQGRIVLREKAKLSVNSLSQTGGSLYMEAGSTLDFVTPQPPQQPPAANQLITLSNLHLSLSSLLANNAVTNPPTNPPAQDSHPAVIGSTTAGSVTISGPIFLRIWMIQLMIGMIG